MSVTKEQGKLLNDILPFVKIIKCNVIKLLDRVKKPKHVYKLLRVANQIKSRSRIF